MYFKLALNNVKKSFKEYTIYFLTLTLSVCIFYVFNSLDSQKAMMKLSESTDMIMQNLVHIIGLLSVFVSIVLGFLVLYANKFLIRRRNKELGLYMLLGMDKLRMSIVLIIETLLISLCSLIAGLGLGIFLSQGLAVFTAKIFGAQIEEFEFVFSMNGLTKSVVCFGIICFIVMIFNVTILSKCQLIDLMYANKKNEVPKVRHLGVAVGTFIVAVICLGSAYAMIIDNGLQALDFSFYGAFVFAFVGTLLFFMSLSGFLLKMIQMSKNLYYKELNMFIFRQINSKINTTYMSMTFICLMLSVTIVAFSSGISLNQSMRDEMEKLTPYDASFIWYSYKNQGTVVDNVEEWLETVGLPAERYGEAWEEYIMYETDIILSERYEIENLESLSYIQRMMLKQKLRVVKLSDYNTLLELQGVAPIQLEIDEYAVNCQQEEALPIIEEMLQNNLELAYGDTVLKSKFDEPLQNTLYNQFFSESEYILIMADEVVQEDTLYSTVFNMKYKSGDMEQRLMDDIKGIEKTLVEQVDEGTMLSAVTRQSAYDNGIGMSGFMTFLTVYISLVLLLTSAALLALQQLTEAEDNKVRYQLLAKLGIEQKMIYRALFIQIGIYFMVPLALAAIHGAVGIYVANTILVVFGKVDVLGSIIFTATMFVVIYGAYFIGTYFSSKSIIGDK